MDLGPIWKALPTTIKLTPFEQQNRSRYLGNGLLIQQYPRCHTNPQGYFPLSHQQHEQLALRHQYCISPPSKVSRGGVQQSPYHQPLRRLSPAHMEQESCLVELKAKWVLLFETLYVSLPCHHCQRSGTIPRRTKGPPVCGLRTLQHQPSPHQHYGPPDLSLPMGTRTSPRPHVSWTIQ